MPGSILAVEEYFQTGEILFLPMLRGLTDAAGLRKFAERWYADPRPWARAQLHAYLDLPLNSPGHQPLVKKLFKLAEAAQDDATMARFMVAFDRSVRRGKSPRWEPGTGEVGETLRAPRVTIPQEHFEFVASLPSARLFSVHTRNYLRRRAWRYFRRLGHRDPKRYLAALLPALALYRDEDAAGGVSFLDNWGLIHALFHDSPVLRSRPHGWILRSGQALRDLKPAPAYPDAWNDGAMFTLLTTAQARPVRRTALAMIKPHVSKVPFDRVLELLAHDDEEVQAFGAELLESAAGLESVPLESWLKLLGLKNLAVLESVVAIMRRVVAPDRLPTATLLGFVCGPVGPVARLGLDWLRSREIPPAYLVELSRVRVASVAADSVALARERMTIAPDFDPEWILAFLDATVREVRLAAWPWFADEKRACSRVDLWAKLVESPYDDVRISIVRHLREFAREDQALRVLLVRAPLEAVWATVLLNIHRGSRAKRMAAAQIAEVIERQPERAPQLLPLLAVAARSIRAPEFRAGLAALVRTATHRPEVAPEVARHFPELKLVP
ncbi:MAG: hypothetical protein HYY17_00240 [Planctomycetes bacterium]|nr:hypothetical protein [Planctomycetota bacterium]